MPFSLGPTQEFEKTTIPASTTTYLVYTGAVTKVEIDPAGCTGCLELAKQDIWG
jgi:hypothetical protein